MGLEIRPEWDVVIHIYDHALSIWFSRIPSIDIIPALKRLEQEHPGVRYLGAVKLYLPMNEADPCGKAPQPVRMMQAIEQQNSCSIYFPPTYDMDSVAHWITYWLDQDYGLKVHPVNMSNIAYIGMEESGREDFAM